MRAPAVIVEVVTMTNRKTMWDERCDTDDYVYGREPNVFLSEVSGMIAPGDVPCLAEGEGIVNFLVSLKF